MGGPFSAVAHNDTDIPVQPQTAVSAGRGLSGAGGHTHRGTATFDPRTTIASAQTRPQAQQPQQRLEAGRVKS